MMWPFKWKLSACTVICLMMLFVFSKFYKMKFVNLVEIFVWPHLAVKGLKIVMESARNHCEKTWVLVQNHRVPVKTTVSLWVFCNHTVNLKTDPELNSTETKICSCYCKAQQRLKEKASFNNSNKNSHRNHTNRIP